MHKFLLEQKELTFKRAFGEDYRTEMRKTCRKTTLHFERLADAQGTIRGLPSYIATLRTLAAHGSELVSSAAPLTSTAYYAAVERLNKIRHETLPQLVDELSKLEEGMALNSGTLVSPAITQMDLYLNSWLDMLMVLQRQWCT